MQQRNFKLRQWIKVTCKDFASEGLGVCHVDSEVVKQHVKPHTIFVWGILPGETAIVEINNIKRKVVQAIVIRSEYAKKVLELQQLNLEKADPQSINLDCTTVANSYIMFWPQRLTWLIVDQYFSNASITQVTFESIKNSIASYAKKLSDDLNKEEFFSSEFVIKNLSKLRISSMCENFTICGGCKMLHIDYSEGVKFKKKWLQNHFIRDKIDYGFDRLKVFESPKKIHYRNHVQLHINKRKERGFYSPGTYTTVKFPQDGCYLFDQKVVDDSFPADLELVRCVRCRIDDHSNTSKIVELNSHQDKSQMFSVTVNYPKNNPVSITFPMTAFFQTNTSILPIWLEKIESLLSANNSEVLNVLELFSGFGFISQLIGQVRAVNSLGIDVLKTEDLGKIFLTDSKYEEIDTTNFISQYVQADLFQIDRWVKPVKKKISKFQCDTMIMNPPRAGFPLNSMKTFFDHVLGYSPTRIIYSSCNAATFSRDCANLKEWGYEIKDLSLFDFFPNTSHYEVLGMLEKVS